MSPSDDGSVVGLLHLAQVPPWPSLDELPMELQQLAANHQYGLHDDHVQILNTAASVVVALLERLQRAEADHRRVYGDYMDARIEVARLSAALQVIAAKASYEADECAGIAQRALDAASVSGLQEPTKADEQ